MRSKKIWDLIEQMQLILGRISSFSEEYPKINKAGFLNWSVEAKPD